MKFLTLFCIFFLNLNVFSSPLSDGAERLIFVGEEISSPDVVERGVALLKNGAYLNSDYDSLFSYSKFVRTGSMALKIQPDDEKANLILLRLVNLNYDPAIFDYAFYLLDGESGFFKNELLSLTLFETSYEIHQNPKSAFMAAVIRNESIAPGTKNRNRIIELLTFASFKGFSPAQDYERNFLNKGYWQSIHPENWREWFANFSN